MDDRIDITDIDKYELLAALCNNTRVVGFGANIPANYKVVDRDVAATVFERMPDGPIAAFDYVLGRPIKVWFMREDGHTYLSRTRLYNRDSDRTAESIIEELRSNA